MKHSHSQKIWGGAGASNASIYYRAVVLTRILDWFHYSSTKLWVQIESHLNLIDLCTLPWTPAEFLKGELLPGDLTRQTIQIWNRLNSSKAISQPMGPMTLLLGTPAFPPVLQGTMFVSWCKEDHWGLAQVLRAGSSLIMDIPPGPSSYTPTHWLHRQVIFYTRTFPSLPDVLTDLSDFENMLLQADPPTHVISQLYSLIHMASNPDLPRIHRPGR